MSRINSLSVTMLLLGLLPNMCQGAQDAIFRNGKFVREGRDFGELTISQAGKNRFTFQLLVELKLGGDGSNDRNGGIEEAIAIVHGPYARYSQAPEPDGFYEQCILTFRRMASYIVVEQDGTCRMWGFGADVSATGTYRLSSRSSNPSIERTLDIT